MLAVELGLDLGSPRSVPLPSSSNDVWRALPYNPSTGKLASSSLDGKGATTMLVLQTGRCVQLMQGNPPMAPVGLKGVVGEKTAQGHYTIAFENGVQHRLGSWMLLAAQQGKLDVLPLLNVPDY